MCCFFRTTVTSFCVKSHSRNSHVCVEELVWSRAALVYLTRKTISIPVEHMTSRRICQDCGQIVGMFGVLLLAVAASLAALMFCWHEASSVSALCCLLSFKMAVIRSDVRPERGGSCYFSPSLHINSLDTRCLWPFSGVSLDITVIFFFFLALSKYYPLEWFVPLHARVCR